jgi:hypothetical protein
MTQASQAEVSKLRIDRSLAPVTRHRRRRWIWILALLLLAGAGGAWFALLPRTVAVTTATVVTTHASQQFVVLNATGYVVAQRKAAIASKATGRLEWLGVAEGSRVKAGEVIARLDNRDVRAQADSAQANVRAARAGLAQAQAEERDAVQVLRQTRTCRARASFGGDRSAKSARGSRRRRRGQRARGDRRRRGGRAQCAGLRRLHADPRALRRRDPVEERQRRRPGDAVLVGGGFQGSGRHHGRHDDARGRGRRSSPVCRRSGRRPEVSSTCPTRLRGVVSHRADHDRAKATVLVKTFSTATAMLPDMSAKVAFRARCPRRDRSR